VGLGLKAQKARPTTGLEGMMGETGEAITVLDPFGNVLVHGEIWKAKAVSNNIEKGQKVRVTGIHNLTLYVEPVS